MIKLLIVIGFALFAGYAAVHFFPTVQHEAFKLGGFAITGTMLIFLGGVWLAWKYTK